MSGTKTVTMKPTKTAAVQWCHLTTLPLYIYWVPCAIARFSRVKSWLWVKHLYPVFYL